jgi:hypothetical protein
MNIYNMDEQKKDDMELDEKVNDDLELVMGVLIDVLGSKFDKIDKNDVIAQLSLVEVDENDELDYSGSYHPYRKINIVVEHFVSMHKKRKYPESSNLDCEKSKTEDVDNISVNAEIIATDNDEEERKDALLISLIRVYPDIDPKFLKQICARLHFDAHQIEDWIEANIDKIPEKKQVQAINRFALESTCRSHEQIWKCPSCETWQIVKKTLTVVKCSEVVSCGEFCMKCNKRDHNPFQCRKKCPRIDNTENEINIFKKLRTIPDEDKNYAKIFILKPQNNLNFSDPLHILYLAAEGTFLRMMEMSKISISRSSQQHHLPSRGNLTSSITTPLAGPSQISSMSSNASNATSSNTSTVASDKSEIRKRIQELKNSFKRSTIIGPSTSSTNISEVTNPSFSSPDMQSTNGTDATRNENGSRSANGDKDASATVASRDDTFKTWKKNFRDLYLKQNTSTNKNEATNVSLSSKEKESANTRDAPTSKNESPSYGDIQHIAQHILPAELVPNDIHGQAPSYPKQGPNESLSTDESLSSKSDKTQNVAFTLPSTTKGPTEASTLPGNIGSTILGNSSNENCSGTNGNTSAAADTPTSDILPSEIVEDLKILNGRVLTNGNSSNVPYLSLPDLTSTFPFLTNKHESTFPSSSDGSSTSASCSSSTKPKLESLGELKNETNGNGNSSTTKIESTNAAVSTESEKAATCSQKPSPGVNPLNPSMILKADGDSQSKGNGSIQQIAQHILPAELVPNALTGTVATLLGPPANTRGGQMSLVPPSQPMSVPVSIATAASAYPLRTPMNMLRKSIKAIKYIENEDLRGRFNSCKSYFLSRGIPNGERLAFHGTSANLDSIIKNNLQLSHGKRFAHGKGIYFSEFPTTCSLYGKHLLLFRVMLGNPYDGHEHTIPEQFQSKIVRPNEEGKANMIIIDKEEQILPAFIIELEDEF